MDPGQESDPALREPSSASAARPRLRSLADDLIAALAQPRYGLVLFILGAGVVALALGIDTSIDTRNYHVYNPWAFLHKRSALDVAPAGLDSFRNPLPDLPFFAVLALGLPAWVTAFLLGIPAGVGAFFFFRITRRIVVDLRLRRRGLALAAIGVVAATGSAGLSQIGAANANWLVAALVLPALFLIVREGQREAGPSRSMLGLAGLLLGLASGLQLAALPYALAGIVAVAVGLHGRPHVLRALFALVAYGVLGGLVTYGLWAAMLAGRYGNPFFPYLNGTFRSEYWLPYNLPLGEFAPSTIGGWLTWPFGLAERNQLMTAVPLREPRLAVLVLVAITLGAAVIVDRLRGSGGGTGAGAASPSLPRSVRTVAVFTATAYVAWLGLSGDYRATIPVELTTSLLLVVGLAGLLRGARHRDLLVMAACGVIVAVTVPPNGGRLRAGSGPYLNVQMPPVAPNAIVVTAIGSIGHLLPSLPPDTRVLRLVGPYRERPFPHRLQQAMHEAVAGHAGPVYLLRRASPVELTEPTATTPGPASTSPATPGSSPISTDAGEDAMLTGFGLVRDEAACTPVRSNLEVRALELCRLERGPASLDVHASKPG